MLSLQSGFKYRNKIEQKLSLAARKPDGDLCDIDPIEEQIFQDKSSTEIANEVRNETVNETDGKKKKGKNKKKKKTNSTKNGGSDRDMFKEILEGSDED